MPYTKNDYNRYRTHKKKHSRKIYLNDVLVTFAIISMFMAIIYMVGIAGGVDADLLSLSQATKRYIAALIVLAVDVIIFIKAEKDDESEFDRL